MNKNNYLLSICIPTYNREKYLKILLESIVCQEGFTDEVSIVINDGPSKDNTAQMVAEFQKKYKNIFYTRNEKAVGMLPAILESIEMSNGEYTWLFGSDDFMQENSLETVVNVIKNKAPTLILSNRFTFKDISECDKYEPGKEKVLYFQGFGDFGTYIGGDEKEKFEDKHCYFTFMSVFCFNTNYYKDTYKYIESNICSEHDLKEHYFNYIVILFGQLFIDKTICVIEEPRLVFCQAGNHNWNHNKKITKDIKMLCNYVKNSYPLSNNCIKILDKFVSIWGFESTIVTPARIILSKIGLYKYISHLWRKYFL